MSDVTWHCVGEIAFTNSAPSVLIEIDCQFLVRQLRLAWELHSNATRFLHVRQVAIMPREKIVDVIPQESDQRLVVVLRQHDEGRETMSQLVLRQESMSDAGWYVQGELALSDEQVASLKVILSGQIPSVPSWTPSAAPATIPFEQNRQRTA